jgi:hypothetical protein
MRIKLVSSLICICFFLLFVEKVIAETEYPGIHLGKPIKQQIQLFATDKVIIHGGHRFLISVWFGQQWEPFIPGKNYIVYGYPGIPIIPKFKATDPDKTYLKLEISYNAHLNKPRDIRNYNTPKPEQ